jgi:hypothetical protein
MGKISAGVSIPTTRKLLHKVKTVDHAQSSLSNEQKKEGYSKASVGTVSLKATTKQNIPSILNSFLG